MKSLLDKNMLVEVAKGTGRFHYVKLFRMYGMLCGRDPGLQEAYKAYERYENGKNRAVHVG